MLVLLRQSETKLYCGARGGWVAKVSLAAQFQTVEEALLFNRQAHLAGMEVVVVHSNGRHRVVLPLGKESWTSTHWNAPGTAVHSHTRNRRAPPAVVSRQARKNCAANRRGRLNRHRLAARRRAGREDEG